MKKDIKWLERQITAIPHIITNTSNNEVRTLIEMECVLKLLNQVEEYKITTVPNFVADFLSNDSLYDFEELIVMLVKSKEGDPYYLLEILPEENQLTQEEGEKLYEYIKNENMVNILNMINGYTIEKDRKYRIKHKIFDSYFTHFRNNDLHAVYGSKNTAYIFDKEEKAKSIAEYIEGFIEEDAH